MKEKQLLNYKEYVERYRPIIDDFDEFLKYSEKPLPKIVWTNLLKTTPAIIENSLIDNQADYSLLEWWPGAFKLESSFKPGKTIEFLSGQIHVQEEVSLLPVVALDPQPNEKILDMCAAPGNKTAGICLKLQDSGLVVSNDLMSGRVALLQNTLSRLGFTNGIVTQQDGLKIDHYNIYDKILVDAPCSAEGNIRKSKWSRRDNSRTEKYRPVQQALLKHALKLVKKGGIVVYSTCTYSPIENEEVVNSVLEPDVHIEAINFPGSLVYSPGITEWNKAEFHPSLRKTCRFWPHQNDTGGFYVAKLRKN